MNFNLIHVFVYWTQELLNIFFSFVKIFFLPRKLMYAFHVCVCVCFMCKMTQKNKLFFIIHYDYNFIA